MTEAVSNSRDLERIGGVRRWEEGEVCLHPDAKRAYPFCDWMSIHEPCEPGNPWLTLRPDGRWCLADWSTPEACDVSPDHVHEMIMGYLVVTWTKRVPFRKKLVL